METAQGGPQTSCYASASMLFNRRVCQYVKRRAVWASPLYEAPTALPAEWRAWQTARRQRADWIVVGELESSFGLLGNRRVRERLRPTRTVAAVHLPPSWWRVTGDPRLASRLDALVTMSSELRDFLEPQLPGRVAFIPHGIDTEFFKPATVAPAGPPRCIFVGANLRDLRVLAEVIETTVHAVPGLEYDLVYPEHARHRHQDLLWRIARQPAARWHSGLSDEQLREAYRRASLLVLPLVDCAANNAVLEAMACGLPIVTTDLPGMRDYTRPTFARLTPPDDGRAMADAVLELLAAPAQRAEMGAAARAHAVNHLAWPQIARQWLEFLQRLPNEQGNPPS